MASAKKKAKVAVITRTYRRPLLLERARKSVQQQTFKDVVWVVANDAGSDDKERVEKIANKAKKSGDMKVVVFHNDTDTHNKIEYLSNLAIQQCDSDYILIHDDDDTLHPEFLEKTVAFMEEYGDMYEGVVSRSVRVNEVVTEDKCELVDTEPYNEWVSGVYLSDVFETNVFPPISFLYKRSAYEAVGGYEDDLPVLGDWDFNIKFLRKFDIGVVPENLANYHFRIQPELASGVALKESDKKSDAYGNTVVSTMDKHAIYDCYIRNKYMREELETGVASIGMSMGVGRQADYLKRRVDDANRRLDNFDAKLRKMSKLLRYTPMRWILPNMDA